MAEVEPISAGRPRGRPPKGPRLERRRRESFSFDTQEIIDRVLQFYKIDKQAVDADRDVRLQRYAKYRQWTESKDWPWEDASNAAIPDMAEKSFRLQDTLHNAVMAQRPVVMAKALRDENKKKEQTVDRLIDFQVFVEQPGEAVMGDLADAFVNDGVFTAFIPWVHEMRDVSDVEIFDPIPADGTGPATYFGQIIKSRFAGASAVPLGDGWDWRVLPDDGSDPFQVKFYTQEKGDVEMVSRREVVVYDGPCVIPKDYDDVLYPPRSANLQMPSPSNPNGAPHVILVDHPTLDEVARLKKDGTYDELSQEDVDSLDTIRQTDIDNEEEEQKDVIAGVDGTPPMPDGAKSHGRVTRLMCFDTYDIDGDGVNEDVIWILLLEPKLLCRAKIMSELYPANPPRRPFAEAAFLPVRGRRVGISLLEILEGLHDVIKQMLDQTVDFGTISVSPFGFYRASSAVKAEPIRLWPGELYPLGDPQRDINFPQFNNNAVGFGINMMTLLSQMEGKVSMVDDLQLGRVPAGNSSALRTVGGMSLLAGQAEARPERLLRRFFAGLCEMWSQIHELNQAFLPRGKQIRIVGSKPGEDPYETIDQRQDVAGRFQFDFSANVLNTSKAVLQEGLDKLMQMYVNEISLQLGIIDGEGIYRLFRDAGKAWGQDPDNYLKPPSPDSLRQRIFAEEALSAIVSGEIPDGVPAEAGGAIEHLQKLASFMQSDDLGLIQDPAHLEVFKGWFTEIQERAQQQQQQQQLLQAAQQFQQGQQGGGAGAPPQGPPQQTGTPQISGGNELIDESLPGAGGGAQQ